MGVRRTCVRKHDCVGGKWMRVFVTAIDTTEFLKALFAKGYRTLVVQRGGGAYVPTMLQGEHCGVVTTNYDYKPGLADEITAADLIISHAGAGSILEALQARCRLLVVVNTELADNHQLE